MTDFKRLADSLAALLKVCAAEKTEAVITLRGRGQDEVLTMSTLPDLGAEHILMTALRDVRKRSGETVLNADDLTGTDLQ